MTKNLETSGSGPAAQVKRRTYLPLAVLIAGGICLGVSPVLVKSIPLEAGTTAFLRVFLSILPVMLWVHLSFRQSANTVQRPARPLAIYSLLGLAGFFFAADLFVMHVSIRHTSVVNATLFTNCAPLFVALFGVLGLTNRPTKMFWKAMPIALLGIILIINNSSSAETSSLRGDAIALTAGALYAAYLTVVKRLRYIGVSSAYIMISVSLISTVSLAPAAISDGIFLEITLMSWVGLLALGFIGHALGQGLVTEALQRLPVSSSSIVLMIQPAVAAVLSWIFLGEAMTALQLTGVLVVLFGLYVAVSPKE